MIAAGSAFTVTSFVTLQVVARMYVIVAVPSAIPVITPNDGSISAMPASLLLHVPPGVELNRGVMLFTHTVAVPEMAPGKVFTIIAWVAMQPVGII
jgi:hypothetical protein